MVLPIGSTPTLEGEEAVRFCQKVEQDLKELVSYIPTPNLWKMKELIRNNLTNEN